MKANVLRAIVIAVAAVLGFTVNYILRYNLGTSVFVGYVGCFIVVCAVNIGYTFGLERWARRHFDLERAQDIQKHCVNSVNE